MSTVFTSDDIDFAKYEKETQHKIALRTAAAWSDEIERELQGGVRLTGDQLPWSKTHELIRFRAGEVTVWAGDNAAGKSMLSNFVALGFIRDGARCCIASFEMTPPQTLMRSLRQAVAQSMPKVETWRKFRDWLSDRLFLYDHVGRADVNTLKAAIRYAAIELKAEHFVVDNLMMCVRGEDDYNGQKDFVESMIALSVELGIHIHIVAHMRKPDSKGGGGGKVSRYNIRGSSAVSDLVHQVMIVSRNEKKEQIIKSSEISGEIVPEDVAGQPDVFLTVDKQRNGTGWTGGIALWFDMLTGQYRGYREHKVVDFMATSQPVRESEYSTLF